MSNISQLKYCFVPGCESTSSDSNPYFIHFFPVPRNNWIPWFESVGRTDDKHYDINDKLYCCSNHFDVITNYNMHF